MSKIASPKCARHPAEKVVGVCCSCLKERLTFLLNTIDAVSPPPPTPSSAFNDDEADEEEEEEEETEKEGLCDAQNQASSDADIQALNVNFARTIAHMQPDENEDVLEGEGCSDIQATGVLAQIHSQESSSSVDCSFTEDQNDEGSCNTPSLTDARDVDVPAWSPIREHGYDRLQIFSSTGNRSLNELRCLKKCGVQTPTPRGGKRARLWRSISISEQTMRHNLDAENAGPISPKVTLRALFALEDEDGNNGDVQNDDDRGAESPKFAFKKSGSRRWCGCVTPSACTCIRKKRQYSAIKAFVLRRCTRRAKLRQHQKQPEKLDKDDGRRREQGDVHKEDGAKVEQPDATNTSCGNLSDSVLWRIDGQSERRFNLGTRAVPPSLPPQVTGPYMSLPATPSLPAKATGAGHSTPSATAATNTATSGPVPATPYGKSPSRMMTGGGGAGHSSAQRMSSNQPVGDVPLQRGASKMSSPRLGQSGLLWFYLAPHRRSVRSRLVTAGRRRRASSTARAFKTLFLYR